MHKDEETWVFRPHSAVPVTVGSWLVVVGFLTAAVYESGPAALVRALPLALAACGLAWLVAYRPRVEVGVEGVLVVNPFTSTLVPWAALVEVRTRFACTFVTPSRTVHAFAAPGPGRHLATSSAAVDLRHAAPGAFDAQGSISIGELPRSASGAVARHVRTRWEHLVETGAIELGVADETPVERHLDTVALVAVTSLAVVGLVLVSVP